MLPLTLAVTLAGCERGTGTATPDGRVDAVVTVAPLAGLVRPLLPEGSTLKVLMVPGRSEHGYEFSPSDFDALARADTVVYVGLGLEPPVAKFLSGRASTARQVVCLGAALGLEDAGTQPHDHAHDHAHNHDESGHDEHDHGPIDPHVWLDPVLVMDALPAIRDSVLRSLDGAGVADDASKAKVSAGFEDLLAKVRGIDTRYREALAPFQDRALVTHHAAFGRLAERYGLRVAAVIRPVEGSEPTPGDLDAVRRAVTEQKAPAIFVEPQFNAAAAERIGKEAGIPVLVLDPIGDGDWIALMEKNLESLVRGLGGPAAGGAGEKK